MESSTAAWVNKEFSNVDFNDKRLDHRFKEIMARLANHCSKTLSSSFEQWKDIKASYRFFSNSKVTAEKMLTPHIEHTITRIKEHQKVLLIQDSCYLDYNNRGKTEGLDLTFRSKLSTESKGLILHNTLALSIEGTPLGIADQRFIERKSFHGENHEESRKIRNWNRPIEEKESIRWIDVVKKSHTLDFDKTEIIHVADRECDIYEFFRDAGKIRENVLIRASKNRSINKTYRREAPHCLLFDYLKSKKAQGKMTIDLQVNDKKKFRKAELSIIFAEISMPPPPNKTKPKDGSNLPIVPLRAIMAIERTPPKSQEPICWVLLTNMKISTPEEAIEKIYWYSYRWNIEVYFKILKSGCGVEKAQLRHADRLKNYITLKSIVAWRLFWITRSYERNSEKSCLSVLTKNEWTILYRKIHKTKNIPKQPPTVGDVYIWIAKLGGYIGRASDPPPGIISIWRGWQRLTEMIEDYIDICG